MHRIAIPVTPGLPLFELAVPCEVFGRSRQDFPVAWWYEVQLCAVQDGPVRTAEGLLFDGGFGMSELSQADTVIVPACADTQGDPPPALLQALRAAYARGTRIGSICTGAFTLAAAGLLDGRQAATHWMHAAELARQWPAVQVEPNVLYTDDGQILTSAGVAAGLDLCLHIVRQDHGTRIANALARRLVIPPHREGGQAQYIEQPLSIDGSPNLGPCLDWARAHLELPLRVEDLARHALMSPRTFARRFRETTGNTPLQWLCAERVRRAQDLLENTDDTIDRVAETCGLGSAHRLRTHFTRINGVTPHEFRRTFRSHSNASCPGIAASRLLSATASVAIPRLSA
jgi:AraC family transcriptional regulator, transcriptional activator FtrA